jgi:Myosin head (motor domain)
MVTWYTPVQGCVAPVRRQRKKRKKFTRACGTVGTHSDAEPDILRSLLVRTGHLHRMEDRGGSKPSVAAARRSSRSDLPAGSFLDRVAKMNIDKVWIPHRDREWVLAAFVRDEGSSYIVESLDGAKTRSTVEKAMTCVLDPTHNLDLDNLCLMNNLHEAPLLDVLRRRFIQDTIYTNTADVLISVNPYKIVPGLYSAPLEYLDLPAEAGGSDNQRRQDKKPHVYFTANSALRSLVLDRKGRQGNVGGRFEISSINQSIIVSGESGAG